MQVWFNSSCLEACPYGYIQTTQVACGKCNDTSLIYYNHTCITSCPLKTFKAFNSVIGGYECLPCYIGCDTCETSDSLSCTGCSEGFFYFNNTCNGGCPAAMHANKLERTCERCPAPCWTCSQPNTDSCTSCLPGYLLHSGTCILNCPENYYQGSYIGEVGVYEVPTCFPKLELVFNLSLTSEARAVNINFNYGVINMILAISEKIKVQIGNTEIDNVLFVLSVVSESKLRFQYLGDQYYPPLSLLNVTINLDSAEFNSNAYQRFRIVSKTATLQLKEIYPFSKVETQFISSSSALIGATGGTVATIQAVNSVTQGALCLSLLWLQIVGELVQIMKFIDIRWPPNVAQFYSTSHIDPSSIVMPIELTGAINDKLNNNYTIPRVFDEYEVSPFFMKNYNNELSNLALWVPIVVFGSLIIRLSKICLSKMAQPLNLPIKSSVKKNKNKKTSKIRESYFATINKLNELMIRVSDSRLWNFLMVFILSIYQSGNLWALFNIRYSTSLVEPSTIETRTSLAIGIIFFLCYLVLLAFITRTLLTNMKHLLQKEEHSRPPHLKKYELLFEDLNCQKRIQLFYLPISLLRVWINAVIVALMSFSPITQIILYWLTNSAFIIYLILCRPLKEKLMRRMTLIIEILAYGCVLFAVILAIVTRYVDIDVVTLDEAGFLFICLSIGSTLAGGILSLIQVLQLVRVLYLYVKDRMGKQKRVQPISLSETQLGSDNISRVSDPAEAVEEKQLKRIDTSKRSLIAASEETKMFEAIGKLSPAFFKKIPKGSQYYNELKGWWDSISSEVGTDTMNLDYSFQENRKNDTS